MVAIIVVSGFGDALAATDIGVHPARKPGLSSDVDRARNSAILRFARGPQIYGMTLSPSGEYAIGFYPVGGKFRLKLIAIDEDESHDQGKVSVSPWLVRRVTWIDDETVIVEQRYDWFNRSSLKFENTHFIDRFSISTSGARRVIDIPHLTPESNARNSIVHSLPDEPGVFLLSYSPDGKSYPGVYRMDVVTGKQAVVVEPHPPVSGWWADADGVVRLGLGERDGQPVVLVRDQEGETWGEMEDSFLIANGVVEPVLIEADTNTIIVKSAEAQGRQAFYRLSMKTGLLVEKLYEHPRYDVSSLTTSSSDQRLLSAEFIDDRLRHYFFDQQYEDQLTAIERAVPNHSVRVVQFSRDDRYWLIFVYSALDPGAYYRFDRESSELMLLEKVRPHIDPAQMSPMVRKTYFAQDGLEIDGFLTVPRGTNGKNLPTVILPHSRINDRDSRKFDYIVQFLASQGFAVFQPNYRGSGGYGYAFIAMARDGWGMQMQDDLADAASFLLDEGIARRGAICVMGKNYAGYSALMADIQAPELFSCAVAISPISDLPGWVERIKGVFGDEAAQSIAGTRKEGELERYSPLHQAKHITRPVLVVHGTNDQLVPFSQSLVLVEKLEALGQPVSSLALSGGDNDISSMTLRILALREIGKFLDQQLAFD